MYSRIFSRECDLKTNPFSFLILKIASLAPQITVSFLIYQDYLNLNTGTPRQQIYRCGYFITLQFHINTSFVTNDYGRKFMRVRYEIYFPFYMRFPKCIIMQI
jgi:hypothetical protein